MREIKFRGWDKVHKEMYYDLCSSEQKHTFIWEMMQYTGLKDSNNKEIYEGDILLNNDRVKGKVFFEEGLCAYAVEFPTYNMLLMDYKAEHYDSMEVLGNIYENPDLLSQS